MGSMHSKFYSFRIGNIAMLSHCIKFVNRITSLGLRHEVGFFACPGTGETRRRKESHPVYISTR